MKRRYACAASLAVLLVITCLARPGLAWHGPGHHRATRLAVASLRGKMPEFFVDGAEQIAHTSVDPEIFALRSLPQLRNQERPEGYIDLELLGGAPLPATRYGLLALCAKKKLNPYSVGLVPYSIAEFTQRLAAALAEYRQWPDNPYIQNKCLVYAGLLAHYAEDLCMPLHTTVHFDGRVAQPGGKSPRSGIHTKVDALIQKVSVDERALVADLKPHAFDELMPAIFKQLRASHSLVDRVYELEQQLPSLDEPIQVGSPVHDFSAERLAAAARFTASLYLTAWRISQSISLPPWHRRPAEQVEPQPPTQPAQKKAGPPEARPAGESRCAGSID